MRKHVWLIITLCGALFLFGVVTSLRMPPDYNYDSDFGRDLWMMEKITQGKYTLVGPQFSFSGLRLAPYHFYLFAPILAIFNSYQAVLYANALLFTAAFFLFFFIVRRNYGSLYTTLGIVWMATSSYVILSGRSPGNAFTYLAFYMVYLAYIFTQRRFGLLATMVLGFAAGIIVNFHPISILLVIVPYLVREVMVKDNWFHKIFTSLLVFTASFSATFLPVLVFELKHDFVILKSVFGPRQSEFLSDTYVQSIGTIGQMLRLNENSFTWIPITGLGLFAIIAFSYFAKRNPRLKKWFVTVVIMTVIFLIFGREVPHYYFPMLMFLQVMAVFFLKDLENHKSIMVLLIVLNLILFPTRFYKPGRNLQGVENNFTRAVQEMDLPNNGINVVLVNDTRLSAPAYEYRYLLSKMEYNIYDEYSYSNSNRLLLVSEKGEIDWESLDNWEISQFGNKELVKKTQIDSTVYYLFTKIQ